MSRSLLIGLFVVVAAALALIGIRRRSPSPAARFAIGDRVRVAEADYWANGATGTIATPPPPVTELAGDWRGHVRMVPTTDGVRPFFWVALDEPRRDADGDGPYEGAEIAERSLVPLDSASRP